MNVRLSKIEELREFIREYLGVDRCPNRAAIWEA